MRERSYLAALFVCLVALAGASASAQPLPSRPITIVVPFPPGGSTDTIARILAEGMRPSLRQPLVIENVSGAAGSIGVGKAARAAPDSYTLSIGSWVTHVVNGAVYKLAYDLRTDFDPVSLITTQPLLVVGKKSLPASTLVELINWLKNNPGKALQGTGGPGGASHVAGIFFQRATGTKYHFVPYRGLVQAIQDLVSGQIDLLMDSPANSLPHVRVGSIKGYAVTAATRMMAAPEIPSADEAGLPGFHITSWHGLWVPKNTPKDFVQVLNAAVRDALRDPDTRKRLKDLGQELFDERMQTPMALADHHHAEINKWWPIIRAANIRAE